MNLTGKNIFCKYFLQTVLFKRNSIVNILKIRHLISFPSLWRYGKNTGLGVEKMWLPALILLRTTYAYMEVHKSL